MSDFDVQHRDCFDSLAAMRDAGGVDLILTSPPYPDARDAEAYGAEFDTSLAGFQRLGDATFEALKPGGVCALNIDGPVRVWRQELGESERSLIAFKVAIDWAERVGLRYVEHCAYVRWGTPIGHDNNPRWRQGWEPVHVFARPGAPVIFNRAAATRSALTAGKFESAQANKHQGGRRADGTRRGQTRPPSKPFTQPAYRYLTTSEYQNSAETDTDHMAAFCPRMADDYVLCYSPPGGLVGDPFAGSGTVPFSCHRHGRRFIGGDLGIRQRDGARWADVVNDGLRQGRLFS